MTASSHEDEPEDRPVRRHPGKSPLLFGLYAAALLVVAAVGALRPELRAIGLGDLRNSRYLLGWLGELGLACLWLSALFLPLGALAVLAMRPQAGWLRRQLRVNLPALLLAMAVVVTAVVAAGTDFLPLPGAARLLVPALAVLAGMWFAATLRKGGHALVWMLPKALLALAVLVGTGAGLLYLALDAVPLAIDPPRVGPTEKRELKALFKGKNPKTVPPGETRLLRISQENLDRLVAWALAIDANPDRRLEVDLAEDRLEARISLGLPTRAFDRRFLNLQGSTELAIRDGEVFFHPEHLRIGRLPVPRRLLALASRLLLSLVTGDERARTLLAPLQRLAIHQQALELSYGRVELPRGFLSELFRSEGASEELAPAVRAQLLNLLARSTTLPAGDARFGAALETAFALAHQRSPGSDAVVENEMALLALGIALGHWRLEQPLGELLSDSERKSLLRAWRPASLRSRHDWVKHFAVSAALVVLSSRGLSLGTGVLKEELDAQGGSGFSFGDLAADRAGTRFAETAIHDPVAADALQRRLGAGFRADDFFPEVGDLPENMQDIEFEQRFGGIQGERYRAMVAEIDRRIAACPGYLASSGPLGEGHPSQPPDRAASAP